MSAQRALVLGAAGQLGQACMDSVPDTVDAKGFSRVTCDVADDSALRRVIDEIDPGDSVHGPRIGWLIESLPSTSLGLSSLRWPPSAREAVKVASGNDGR